MSAPDRLWAFARNLLMSAAALAMLFVWTPFWMILGMKVLGMPGMMVFAVAALGVGGYLVKLVDDELDCKVRPPQERATKAAEREHAAAATRWSRLVSRANKRDVCNDAAEIALVYGEKGQYESPEFKITVGLQTKALRVETTAGLVLEAALRSSTEGHESDSGRYHATPDGSGGFQASWTPDYYVPGLPARWEITCYAPGPWENAVKTMGRAADIEHERRKAQESVSALRKSTEDLRRRLGEK
jgi:hypothetical protein